MSIKLALLGAWHVHAIHHLQDSMANPDTEVVVVWDRVAERGQAFADQHGIAFEADLDAVLSRSDIKAVIVDTATSEHPQVIGAAIKAGKHVFAEKLLAIRPTDAQALVRAAADAGIVLRVSLQRLIEAPIQTAKRLVDAGAVGRITATRIRYAHHGALGTPWIPKHFFNRDDAGGGAMIDLGAHPIYLGMLFHDARPQSIRSVASEVANVGVDDNVASLLAYPDGAISVAEASFVAGFFSYSIEITGTRGTISIGPSDPRVMLRRADSPQWVEQELAPALPSTFDQFIAEMQTGKQDADHAHTAIELTRVIEAAYRSIETGMEVTL
jgi:1,5-anhydro-D-fructose reductase (1,5-anhydro-D-mannitol-forming)